MSNTIYIEYDFKINPVWPASEILIAELGEREFESFVEKESGLMAYILKEDWNEAILADISILENPDFEIDYQVKEIEQQNWNVTWEKNFEPIYLGNDCTVRATFHEKSGADYDIIIEPKMSFGTGHHETTRMMLRHILDTDFQAKSVLDMGSGTGVLAILAEMKGASNVDAIDIDHWCFLNAQENVERNNCSKVKVLEGDSGLLSGKEYDIILANINRNILLKDIPVYSRCLKTGGMLFLSGFYPEDIEMIRSKCDEEKLKYQHQLQEGDWVSVKFLNDKI